jgi:hypothetical protein
VHFRIGRTSNGNLFEVVTYSPHRCGNAKIEDGGYDLRILDQVTACHQPRPWTKGCSCADMAHERSRQNLLSNDVSFQVYLGYIGPWPCLPLAWPKAMKRTCGSDLTRVRRTVLLSLKHVQYQARLSKPMGGNLIPLVMSLWNHSSRIERWSVQSAYSPARWKVSST